MNVSFLILITVATLEHIGLAYLLKQECVIILIVFGFPPPVEVEEYLRKFDKRYYNSFEIQKINQVICGHFCIYVLVKLNRGNDFYKILDELYKYNYI